MEWFIKYQNTVYINDKSKKQLMTNQKNNKI